MCRKTCGINRYFCTTRWVWPETKTRTFRHNIYLRNHLTFATQRPLNKTVNLFHVVLEHSAELVSPRHVFDESLSPFAVKRRQPVDDFGKVLVPPLQVGFALLQKLLERSRSEDKLVAFAGHKRLHLSRIIATTRQTVQRTIQNDENKHSPASKIT